MEWSLQQRVSAHNRRWPGNPITLYRLRQLYYQYSVKQRVLRIDIQLNQTQLENQRKGRLASFPRFLRAVNDKEELLFMDEAMFTT